MTKLPTPAKRHVTIRMMSALALLVGASIADTASTDAQAGEIEGVREMVTRHAHLNAIPETLLHRIVQRESRYNPRAHGRGHYGLMQISLPTARQMGYKGAPAGLYDAETNLTYGVPYLANAWLVSGHNEGRAVRLYSRGYYYEAKRKGLLPKLRTGRTRPLQEADAAPR